MPVNKRKQKNLHSGWNPNQQPLNNVSDALPIELQEQLNSPPFSCVYMRICFLRSGVVASVWVFFLNLLLELNKMIPCNGFGMVLCISKIQTDMQHNKVYAGKLHSLKCCGIAQSEDHCLQCKYLHIAVDPGILPTYQSKTENVCRNLITKLDTSGATSQPSESIEKMKRNNEAIGKKDRMDCQK